MAAQDVVKFIDATKTLKGYLENSLDRVYSDELYQSLDVLLIRDSNKFWKAIRKKRKSYIHSDVNIDKFADHYSNIMQDKTLNPEQTTISDCVVNKYSEMNKYVITYNICPDVIDECIVKLKLIIVIQVLTT